MSAIPTFREAVRFWLKLGFISFGGPAGQIAVMHTEIVERRKWIAEDRFLHALNFCMLLPGPEATQLATYCGWWLHGARGGIVAGTLFVLPSVFILWALSWVYAAYGALPAMDAMFHGLKAAVTAIVVAAVIRIGRRALKTPVMWLLAAAAFVAIFFGRVPFPVIVAAAALFGFLSSKRETAGGGGAIGHGNAISWRSTFRRAGKVIAISLAVWWTPIIAALIWQGPDGILVREGVFFSKAAMVTFGGAYAVLPYVGQQAVETHGWLSGPQMLDGLGLAETTPGPLIMVLQFVGFLGGWNQPGALSPLGMATLGAAITTWTTFVPCFLWIFLGGPHLEALRRNERLAGALGAVTAAVVGVILNLAVWFGLQVFLPARPESLRVDWFAIAIAVAASIALERFKASVISVVLASAALGWIFLWLQGR